MENDLESLLTCLLKGNLLENVRMGLDTLWQHKLRSALTVLGVVIGTMTVIVIAVFVSGIDARVSKEIESFGTNSIYVYRFDQVSNFNPSQEERMRKPLSYEDTLAIQAECLLCSIPPLSCRQWIFLVGLLPSALMCVIATSK